MPREPLIRSVERLRHSPLPQAWRRPLGLLALAWLILGALSASAWSAMAHQWWDVSTYNHVLLIPFIIAWLVRARATQLVELRPAAWWPGLVALAGAMFVWLLGTVSGFDSLGQLGAVLMLQAAVLALLGPRVATVLQFPLCYMIFLVPFGGELVPALQLATAKLAIALTELSGVPAQIEGVFIDTPAGLFIIAEACSGVKFLIAMLALGALVAHLCFRSWRRRVAFMLAAIALPILANGVRAWGTIYIAQSQGIGFAAGFDHIFYGWLFFALVMTVLLGVSWRFFDRPADDQFEAPNYPILVRFERLSGDGRAVLGVLLVMVAGFALWAGSARSLAAEIPSQIDLPEVAGWQRVEYSPLVWWEPSATGADHRLLGRYRNIAGDEVDVFFALYASQGEGRDASADGEGALTPDTPWRWVLPAKGFANGNSEWLQANGKSRRLVVTWYHSGDLVTGSRSKLKLATMADRLAMRARPVSTLILSAESRPGHEPGAAVAAFVAAIGSTGAWMDGVAQVP